MAFLKYTIILSVLLLLPDIYIYLNYVAKCNLSKWVKRSYWLLDIIIIALLVGFMIHPIRTGMSMTKISTIIIFMIIFGRFSFTLISLIGRLLFRKKKSIRRGFDIVGLLFCLLTVGCIIYSFTEGYKRYVVKHVTIYAKGLPKSFDGYRIVQFSDLHIGSFANEKDNNVQKIVNLINAQRPDMIVFTGDLVNMEASELNGFQPVLSSLKAKDSVYSILGNHDYGRYRRWNDKKHETADRELLKEKERSFGWKLLLNQNTLIHRGDSCIALLGSEDYGTKAAYKYGDLKKSMLGLPYNGKGLYKILLTHDPSHWHLKVLPETDIQLTLSGHTHAMQIKIGSFSPCQWLFDEWDGLYAVGNRQIYVDTGVGALMSYRFGAWPQISVITLRRITK